ncbi:MAG: protein-export chaperone SecB [Candidatus Muiribacteriota bacterium]
MKNKIESNYLKFLGYKISKMKIEIAEDFNFEKESELDIGIAKKFEIEENISNLQLNLHISNKNNSLNIEMDSIGGFEKGKKVSEEDFKKFMTVNAPSILFPYLRSTLTSVTSQMGINPIILPTINFSTEK